MSLILFTESQMGHSKNEALTCHIYSYGPHLNYSDFNEYGFIILYVIFMNNDFTYVQDEFLLSTK